MKALIQNNFTSGIGDFFNTIYEYFVTIRKLKKLGYDKFTLRLYLHNNVYMPVNEFWNFFNIKTFESIFHEIEIVNQPIREFYYKDYTCVGIIGRNTPGAHCWDLFLENGYSDEAKNSYTAYSYSKPDYEYIDFLHPELIKKYEQVKNEYGFDDYVSVYFRANDLFNTENIYELCKYTIDELIKTKEKIYLATNEYLIKNYYRKYSEKILTYNFPGETEYNVHYNYNKLFYDNLDLLKSRTEFTIFEMLTLSDSKEIYHFTTWDRSSNFLLFAKVKNVPIHIRY